MNKIPALALALSLVACAQAPEINIALHKQATASSAYDHNLTAQLLTDGIVDTAACYLVVWSSEGLLNREVRERTIDGHVFNHNVFYGKSGWIEYQPVGYEIVADKAELLFYQLHDNGDWGDRQSMTLPVTKTEKGLRLDFKFPYDARWHVIEAKLTNCGVPVEDVLPLEHFHSVWMTDTDACEWVTVDLGSVRKVTGARIHWVNPPIKMALTVSDDGENWHHLGANKIWDDRLDFQTKCRYVRVLLHKPACVPEMLGISEIEIYGPGIPVTRKNGWEVSREGSDDWIPATVPGTVLMSYVDNGIIADPDYGDNIAQISDSYFNSNFIYRRTFDRDEVLPDYQKGKRVFLDFDGINWKAEVTLNGKYIGRIDGAFIRGHFNVTSELKETGNVLEVKILRVAHPGGIKEKTSITTGANGGAIGSDSPTFMASIGWDWITTVRGRNIGIWNDVRFVQKGRAEVADPLVVSTLSEDGKASMTATVVVRDSSPKNARVEVEGWIGDIRFSKKVDGSGEVSFTPEEFPQLADQQMELWWPNEYGQQYLYDAGYIVKVNGEESDRIEYKAGIREVTWDTEGGALRLYVNGRRLDGMGGNWGFSQQNLRYSAEQYDIAVAYHQQMHFNMIRNWVGQIGDEEFYDACDRYGITIWQDFWLANPADGPDPDDEPMFLRNAEDLVAKIRRHPSLVIYCGRNEGVPPATLDDALKNKLLPSLHPNMPYISDSADGPVSGRGPYWMEPAEYYFRAQSGKLHSERGMPNVPTFESLSKMMPEDCLWPQNEMWGKHDFTLEGAQRVATYNRIFEETFGEAADAREFTALAQWFNYEGYRAMFESENSRHRMGLLLWMSHSCWPSMVWCTYDYYFEPTGAFFGCKKACEPLHIQYNAATANVELVNICSGDQPGLQALCRVYGLKGNLLSEQSECYDLADDSSLECFPVAKPEGEETYYIVLSLSDAAGNVVSDNYYMKGDLKAARSLPAAELRKKVTVRGNTATVTLRNVSDVPALLVRLILKDRSGAEILPVDYTDNYLALMPGAEKTVTIRWTGTQKVAVDVVQK